MLYLAVGKIDIFMGGKMPKKTDYKKMSPLDIKKAVRKIAETSNSPDEIRKRMVEELGYPYSPENIAVDLKPKIGCAVQFRGPSGEALSICNQYLIPNLETIAVLTKTPGN